MDTILKKINNCLAEVETGKVLLSSMAEDRVQ